MEIITKILYWISTGLMIPVVILLLIFFFKSLLQIGRFYAVYMLKLKFNKLIHPIIDTLNVDNVSDQISEHLKDSKHLLAQFLIKSISPDKLPVFREKVLADYEIECQKSLAESQSLAKLGPVLGLMGTLIPMGPALVGLASGDIASMASNMQVAFSTTVIGLLIGAVGFVIMQVRRRWCAEDYNTLEYVIDLINLEREKEAKTTK